MTTIGIPSTRVSDIFVRQRLLSCVQTSQVALYDVLEQISTGKRISIASEDAPASARIISLQRLGERKEQVITNITTTKSYLSVTDSAMATISDLLTEAQGIGLSSIDTVATQEERNAAAEQIQAIIQQLMDTGNQVYEGRYLFSGSSTDVRPFVETESGYISYVGNENHLTTYGDIDLLIDTNVTGAEAFGAISEAIESADRLTPAISLSTSLSDINRGSGVVPSSIYISDGSSDPVAVDLSSARTIGDVVELIRSEPTVGEKLQIELTRTGLNITLPGTVGSLTITDVGSGKTAQELGIYNDTGVSAGTALVGEDMEPVVEGSTELDALYGSPARAYLYLEGSDNNIVLEADSNGAAYNGMTVSFYDDGAVTAAGMEEAHYDAVTNTLRININQDETTAIGVVNAINNSSTIPYTASLGLADGGDATGDGSIDIDATATTGGGEGTGFDRSGLQIVNGNETYTFDLEDAVTVQDLLNTLNASGAGLTASINAERSGIRIRSTVSGADYAIGENGGRTAQQLGVRTFTGETRLDDLNYGYGVGDTTEGSSQASVTISFEGSDNDIRIDALAVGADWNGFTVEFVDPGTETVEETAVYDEANKRITFYVASGVSTAADVVAAFQNCAELRENFEIALPDENGMVSDGSGVVREAQALTSGGTAGGVDFSITRVNGDVLEVDITGLETIGDVIDYINNLPENRASSVPLVARLNAQGNGIELVDDYPASGTLTVTRSQLSTAAIDLGLIPKGQTSAVAGGASSVASVTVESAGVNNNLVFSTREPGTQGNGVSVAFTSLGARVNPDDMPTVDYDESTGVLTVGLYDDTTAAEVVAAAQADAHVGATFEVAIDPSDDVDPLDPGGGIVSPAEASYALAGGEAATLSGEDANPRETAGVFTALMRLEAALRANDTVEMARAMELLEEQQLNVSFVRAELGSREQSIKTLQYRVEDEQVSIKESISLEYDVDFADAVTRYSSLQASYEAALQVSGSLSQMTLLDYL